MKKLIIAITLMVSSSAIAQTNYNTIMNPKQRRDSIKREIKLHMAKANTLEKVGNGIVITAIISAIATYHLCDGRQSIYVPLAIGGGALFTYHLSARQEMKADKLRKLK
jgi:hypothetical protein